MVEQYQFHFEVGIFFDGNVPPVEPHFVLYAVPVTVQNQLAWPTRARRLPSRLADFQVG